MGLREQERALLALVFDAEVRSAFLADPHAALQRLGLPAEKWYVSPETRSMFEKRQGELQATYDAWQKTYGEWKAANPEKAKLLQDAIDKKTPSVDQLLAAIPEFDASKSIATREAGSIVLQPLADQLPMYLTGSADLFGSTKNYIKKVSACVRACAGWLVGWRACRSSC